ncbi:MAG: hypothetical protein ACHBN1_27690 [Heteroscytonema crispum UTEX LB 1556]
MNFAKVGGLAYAVGDAIATLFILIWKKNVIDGLFQGFTIRNLKSFHPK